MGGQGLQAPQGEGQRRFVECYTATRDDEIHHVEAGFPQEKWQRKENMYLDKKKAHVIPLCEQDVYVELPGEAEVEDDECGRLIHWLYGCRPAAQAWEEHYSALLKNHGFKRLKSVPVQKLLEDKYELKNRGRLGFGPNGVRKIDMLGRVIELTHEGITLQGDPRHFDLMQEYFGMDDKTKILTKNGYEDGPEQVQLRETELSMEECKAFRMIAARLNYMAHPQRRSTGTWPSREPVTS